MHHEVSRKFGRVISDLSIEIFEGRDLSEDQVLAIGKKPISDKSLRRGCAAV
jgi:hypothetical protein